MGFTIQGQFWTIFGISATFIGTVVGAGFASGQEIYQFFSVQGLGGCLGLVLSIILMGFAGMKIFTLGLVLKPSSYQELLLFLFGSRLGWFMDWIVSFFFIILVGVMFAGSGAIFEGSHVGYLPGIIITAILVIGVLFQDLPGLMAANQLIVPLMFIGSLAISIFALQSHSSFQVPVSNHLNWILAALQFSSYNLVLSIPVLLALGKRYPFASILKWGGWLGSIGLGVMAGFIYGAILCHFTQLRNSPLPMVELARNVGLWAYWGYSFILWCEMFTTLLANTYGVAQRLSSLTGAPFKLWVLLVIAVGIFIAKLGFMNLIAGCYPIYGYICFVILIIIFIKKIPTSLKPAFGK